MYLDDFLILISDLHPNFQFFYQNKFSKGTGLYFIR